MADKSFQVWILCETRHAQRVKDILAGSKQLSTSIKVKPSSENDAGFMLVPTTLNLETVEDARTSSQTEILRTLGLLAQNAGPLKACPIFRQSQDDKTGATGINPLTDFVNKWLLDLSDTASSSLTKTDLSVLLGSCPKRWTVYHPMILLPTTSFQGGFWPEFLSKLDQASKESLWKGIISAISVKEGGSHLTHLAVNSAIPATDSEWEFNEQDENILRRPSGLITLYGDFGPSPTLAMRDKPTSQDLQDAFWVSTKQNGIHQVWAPRYTMFSRGNIKEKARILAFHTAEGTKVEESRREAAHCLGESAAIDLYAGIGYFAFSYVQMGMAKVFCWEINPWSVEGMRRGAELNGWKYEIISQKVDELPLLEGIDKDAKVIIFEESNEYALERFDELRRNQRNELHINEIVHVNCGFLPSSRPAWKTAWKILSKSKHAWLHLHENVGAKDIEQRQKEVEAEVRQMADMEEGRSDIKVSHVELVKTYAPEVWHVVFDIHSTPISS